MMCNGTGYTSAIAAGIDWAISDHTSGPAVMNMSLGGISQALDGATRRAVADGITFVVSAGNASIDACNSPLAHASSAITVGTTDDWD